MEEGGDAKPNKGEKKRPRESPEDEASKRHEQQEETSELKVRNVRITEREGLRS